MTKPSTVEHIHDEPGLEPWPARRHSPHRPKLSYKQAMSNYMVNQAGQVVTVRDVHTADFEHMVEACIPTATNSDKCAEALEGLHYFERNERKSDMLDTHNAREIERNSDNSDTLTRVGRKRDQAEKLDTI
jgi:hypothetical protein